MCPCYPPRYMSQRILAPYNLKACPSRGCEACREPSSVCRRRCKFASHRYHTISYLLGACTSSLTVLHKLLRGAFKAAFNLRLLVQRKYGLVL